jgi:hypothetical protein
MKTHPGGYKMETKQNARQSEGILVSEDDGETLNTNEGEKTLKMGVKIFL